MIETGQSILQTAGTTAAIGMGVVFSALFLLSVYMHFFKGFIARVEGRHRAGKAPAVPAAAPAPELAPVPAAAAEDDGAQVAAAIAVGLHLRGGVSGEVAAAIATALALQKGRLRAALRPRRESAPWQMAGRMEMMGARLRRQER